MDRNEEHCSAETLRVNASLFIIIRIFFLKTYE